ncbi:MAG: hypothetical protein EXQ99_01530 [Alphaproteobacteria bacterium]|nr:hypothetical protein [Alphaproteobacteria bacterium]
MIEAGSAFGYGLVAIDVVIALGVSAHIALNKRDDRAAVTWLMLVWLSPFVGAALYMVVWRQSDYPPRDQAAWREERREIWRARVRGHARRWPYRCTLPSL